MDWISRRDFPDYLKLWLAFQETLNHVLTAPAPLQEFLDPLKKRLGKQLRPRLFFLAACPGSLPYAAVHIAVGVELLHLASLIHDDVLDGSPKRRGGVALWQKAGPHMAILLGDFLFTEAFNEFARSGLDKFVMPVIRRLILGMVGAEVEQVNHVFHAGVSERTYRRRMHLKTARFFAVSTSLGAAVSGLPTKIIRNAYLFGESFGMAYQLSDDFRDLFSDDLGRGIFSLPIAWLEGASEQGGQAIKIICQNKAFQSGDDRRIRRLLKERGVQFRVEREIKGYLARAKNYLGHMESWNQMRLTQFLNDTQPLLLKPLDETEGLSSQQIKPN